MSRKKLYLAVSAVSVLVLLLFIVSKKRDGDTSGSGASGANPEIAGKEKPTYQQRLQPEIRPSRTEPDSPDAIATVSGKSDRRNYLARGTAVSKLSNDLSKDVVEELLDILRDKEDAHRGDLDRGEFESLRNDILVKLLGQDVLASDLGKVLVETISDREHNDVWRDYCVQHLAPYYQRKWGGLSADEALSSRERDEIEKAYWKATEERGNSLAGTSLIGLELLSRSSKELDRERILQVAAAFATDDNSDASTRISSLRIVCREGRKDVLPYARALAQSGETIPLRVAGIAALGDIGDESDLEYIETILQTRNKSLKPAAELARKKLMTRAESQ